MSGRFVQLFWLVMLGVLAFGVFWQISEWRHARGLQRVREQMAVYRFAEAREWLADLPSWRSGRPEEAYRLGVCEHAGGDIPAALAAWSRVPPDSEWGIQAGLARARTLVGDLGRFTDAEEIFLELMDALPSGRSPLRDEVRASLAELWFWQGRRDEVSRLLESTWKTTTDPIGVLRDRWRAETATTMVEMIRADVEQAARKAPDDDRVWLARASLAFQDARYDEARQWLDRCLERRPKDPAVWMARLTLAREIEDLDEVQRALEVLPADRLTAAERLSLFAWLARRRGDTTAEQDALERLLTLPPADPRTLDRLATLASEAGDPDAAVEYRRRKAALDAAKDRYRFLMNEEIVPDRFTELAELAGVLGRRFEANAWWTLRISRVPTDIAAREALNRLRALPEPDPPAPGVTLATALAQDQSLSSAPAIASQDARPGELVVPSFQDIAAESGLTFVFDNGRSPERQMPETTAGGVGLLDYDGDGWMDVYVVQGGPFPPDPSRPSASDRLFRNRGDGTFEDVSEASGITGLTPDYGHGVTVGDIDNDGHPDLFLTRWRAYQLLRNNGDGTFEDVTAAWGLDGDRDWPTSAAFADLDNDGRLDLYVCHYLVWDVENPMLCRRVTVSDASELSDPDQLYNYCSPRLFPALQDHLFRNDGERFVDVTEQAGIVDPEGRGLGVVAADVDGDGLVDLYVANDTTADYLWRNLGDFRFEDVAFSSGVACNADGAFQAGMGTACGDVDGDGLPDLLVTNFYGEGTTFFKNLGGGMFGDTSASIGLTAASRYLLGFGIALLDANNDGALDIATANGHVNDDRPDYPYDMPATLLLGNARGRLIDVTQEVGPSWATPRVSRGLATGDLDNDGRVDVVLLPQMSPMAYLHNRTQTGGHFVTFQLVGTQSNRDGIGAVVTVEAGGKTQRAWRVGGGSFQSSSDPRLRFGLGDRSHLERVEVRWPSGQVDRFPSVAADRAYWLREGAAELTPLDAGWSQQNEPMTGTGTGIDHDHDNAAE